MRKCFYTQTAIDGIANLATDDETDSIDAAVAELAKKPRLGYPLWFQFTSEKLWRFEVGRFVLTYRFTKDEFDVLAVEPL